MFKDNLKQARKNAHLTQSQLAQLLNVSNNAISNWENGISRPDIDQVADLCEFLKVSPNYLIDSIEIETAITAETQIMINKYQSLDTHGKKVVDIILDMEYERCTEQIPVQTKNNHKSKILLRTT